MMIRRAAIQDLEQIMQIYARAVQYMHASGNPNQWMEGYPSRALIEEDIARGVSYVVDRDGVIEAVFSYIEGEDPTYRQIEQGMWRTNGSYGTVHRLASAGRLRGVAGICLATASVSAYVRFMTRPTSRMAARAAMVPNVTICATWSLPYLPMT